MGNNQGFCLNQIRITNKLVPYQVIEIRRQFWVQGLQILCIARLHGINPSTVHDAIHFRTWANVPKGFTEEEMHPDRRRKYRIFNGDPA